MASQKTKTPMTDDHKKALAEGREAGRAVRQYLDALEDHRPRRGRPVSPERLQKRLSEVDEQIKTASAFDRLLLIQQKMDLEEQLARTSERFDLTELEHEFVKVAARYADRRGITFKAFREVGVPADVLKQAGIN